MIALNGVCRFRLHGHDLAEGGYRLAQVDWSEFAKDLEESQQGIADRERMFTICLLYTSPSPRDS